MVGCSSNLKNKLRGPNQNKKCLKGRRPPIEDDLQWKTTSNGSRLPIEVELQWKTTSNGWWPPMEDDLNFCCISLNEDDFKYSPKTMLHVSKGKFRGNLECGPAQPSLFSLFLEMGDLLKVEDFHLGVLCRLSFLSAVSSLISVLIVLCNT